MLPLAHEGGMLIGGLRWLVVAAAAAAVLVPSPRAGAAPPAEPFAAWLGLTLDEIAAHRLDPPHASRLLATVSVADERAVARVEGRSAEIAAVNGAAATVLPYFFPDRTAAFAGLAAPFEHERGFAAGVDAGRELLARAAADGADTPWTGVIPVGPEFWVPTPPAFLPPLLPG